MVGDVLEALHAHLMLPRGRVSRSWDVPPGEGRLHLVRDFIGIVVHDEERASTARWHEGLEVHKKSTRCSTRPMRVLEGRRRRILWRAWHPVMGQRILAFEERQPHSIMRARGRGTPGLHVFETLRV